MTFDLACINLAFIFLNLYQYVFVIKAFKETFTKSNSRNYCK